MGVDGEDESGSGVTLLEVACYTRAILRFVAWPYHMALGTRSPPDCIECE